MLSSWAPGRQVNNGDAKTSSHRDTISGAGPRIVMTVSRENLIGEYLRARRELVLPEDVGLPKPDPRRRVPVGEGRSIGRRGVWTRRHTEPAVRGQTSLPGDRGH
jgi:hypothetical protein